MANLDERAKANGHHEEPGAGAGGAAECEKGNEKQGGEQYRLERISRRVDPDGVEKLAHWRPPDRRLSLGGTPDRGSISAGTPDVITQTDEPVAAWRELAASLPRAACMRGAYTNGLRAPGNRAERGKKWLD